MNKEVKHDKEHTYNRAERLGYLGLFKSKAELMYMVLDLEEKVNQLETNRDEEIEEIKDLLEHWKGNDLVERDLNTLLTILERGKE